MSRGATARLFVAVELPPAACEELAEWARAVAAAARASGGSPAALRLVDAHALHLTLCFLGSRPVGEIESFADVLATCAEGAFELSVGAPLWLPSRRPHALAVEVHDRSGELKRLQERLSGALASVSAWQPERRRFRPHVTLARVRRGARARSRPTQPLAPGARDGAGQEQPLPATPRLGFTAQTVVLYRSWLAPDGARYEALAQGALDPAER